MSEVLCEIISRKYEIRKPSVDYVFWHRYYSHSRKEYVEDRYMSLNKFTKRLCENPIRFTGDMRTWYTSKPCQFTQKSHINQVVIDSTWEASEAYQLDKSPHVEAWAKNDHLGFFIMYTYRGVIRKYYPDFIIRLENGEHLILETKGQDSDIVRTKRACLQEWVKAVNNHGGFGIWHEAISYNPNDLKGLLEKNGRKLSI